MPLPVGQNMNQHRRFYVFMTSLVVGAILILMIINEDGGQKDVFTSASVAVDGDKKIFGDALNSDQEKTTVSEKDIQIQIHSSTIPDIPQSDVRIAALAIESRDTKNKLQVNQEAVDIQNRDHLKLSLKGFQGEMDFDDFTISLDGEVDGLSINDVGLSTKTKMKIVLHDLSYDTLDMKGITLESASMSSTDGGLVVPGRLDYGLDNDDVQLSHFLGDLSIGLDERGYAILEGRVKGFSVSGGLTMEVK